MWTLYRHASHQNKYLYWCGYLNGSKTSFNLSPGGQHAVIKLQSDYPREHLETLRETFAVTGELREVHDPRSDVKRELTFTDDYDANVLLEGALLREHSSPQPVRHIEEVYRAVFGS